MTVPSTADYIAYAGDGTSTEFPIPFSFASDDDIRVVFVDTDGAISILVLDSDYSLTGSGTANGGTLTLSTELLTDQELGISLEPSIEQDTEYTAGDVFPSAATERALDQLTRMNKALVRKALYEPMLSVSSSSNVLELDISQAKRFRCVLTENITSVTLDTLPPPGTVTRIFIDMIQDSTGSRTYSPGANFLHVAGYHTLSTAAGSIDQLIYDIYPNGTAHGILTKGYA